MASAAALAAYAALLVAGAVLVWRRPLAALYVFIVGLALHNVVMATLYGAGVRGNSLTAIQAWKEALLGVAVASVSARALRERRLPFRAGAVDALALAFAALVGIYALVPQDVLDGRADAEGVLYALRSALVPVVAYLLGRAVVPRAGELRRLAWVLVGTAAAVAVTGIVEVYSVSLDYWRDSGAPGWFGNQLGFEYRGLSGLPENFVFNTGDEDDVFRRLVATFLSPLAAAYLFVVAVLLLAVAPARRASVLLAVPLAAALLLTHTRAAYLALAGALVVLAVARRRVWPVGAAAVTVALGVAAVLAFPHVAPETRFTASELAFQRANAAGEEDTEHGGLDPSEPSVRSHLTNLREGAEAVARHPQGYGLGNAGSAAVRSDVPLKAGESTYTELGVQVGVAGVLLFLAWCAALLLGLIRSARARIDAIDSRLAAGVAAGLAAVLALGLQTDVLGIPWLTYCVWWLAGSLVSRSRLPEGSRTTGPAGVSSSAPPRSVTLPTTSSRSDADGSTTVA